MIKRAGVLSLPLVVLLLTFQAPAASGQVTSRTSPPPVSLAAVTSEGPPAAPEFGTLDYSVEQVISYGFAPVYPPGDTFTDNGNGYRWATSGSEYFATPVHLPSGVVIDYIGLNYCDSDPTNVFTLTMYDFFGQNGVSAVGSISPPAAQAGCGYKYNSTPFAYQYSANTTRLLNFILYQPNITTGTLSFRGAEVWYRRVVSQAPLTATFNDVPTTHPFFQYIEALKASGITGGCQASPPLYCPDNPLTRGQMAVFLAKALGLHWPL